jgi:hypothetical protein
LQISFTFSVECSATCSRVGIRCPSSVSGASSFFRPLFPLDSQRQSSLRPAARLSLPLPVSPRYFVRISCPGWSRLTSHSSKKPSAECAFCRAYRLRFRLPPCADLQPPYPSTVSRGSYTRLLPRSRGPTTLRCFYPKTVRFFEAGTIRCAPQVVSPQRTASLTRVGLPIAAELWQRLGRPPRPSLHPLPATPRLMLILLPAKPVPLPAPRVPLPCPP